MSFILETSQNRSQPFQQFKKAIDSFDYDVVIDGANVGFSTSNRREASQSPFSLSVNEIQTAVDSFLDQHKRPLVILHSYHIRHLKRFHPQQLAVLDVSFHRIPLHIAAADQSNAVLRAAGIERWLVLAVCLAASAELLCLPAKTTWFLAAFEWPDAGPLVSGRAWGAALEEIQRGDPNYVQVCF